MLAPTRYKRCSRRRPGMFGARAPDSRRSRAAVVQWARPFLDMPFPRQGGDVLWASDHIGALASIGLR